MATIRIDSVQPTPHWALLERQLIDVQADAIQEYYARYFDARGYLLCVPRWGGNDGPDDAAENFLNWTTLHALGTDASILSFYKRAWEGHLQQYTEARTTKVELGRDGMYYKEFPVVFDWFHHAEGFSAFFLEGLADPTDRALIRRSRRYAGMFMGEEPGADNWDPKNRMIRSMFNGSRGPLLRRATAMEWAGDPIEVAGRFKPGHNENTFDEMLDHFHMYTDVVGDHPLNLGTTTMALNAFALTGEAKYRDWVLDYATAWTERAAANNGILPSHVCLDGKLNSGACDGFCNGKWWGGTYGWGFTVPVVPRNGQVAHRNTQTSGRAPYGLANALLLSGDRKFVDVWRSTIDAVNANAREIDGRTQYPRMHGADGWYAFEPTKFAPDALELWYWTRDRSHLELLPQKPRWVAYLDGADPTYPVAALHADLERVRNRVAEQRADTSTPDTRMSDDPNDYNPASTDALIQLALGGLPTGRTGHALHCQLRYFDPARQRAGLPLDVAALVEQITDGGVVVSLANLSPRHERTVVVQGGAYGEHQVIGVSLETQGQAADVNARAFSVKLAPGSGGKVAIGLSRYANPPTLSFPAGVGAR